MFALELAAAAFVLFVAGVIRDARSYGNAVLLGLALALGALGFAERLADTPGTPARLLVLALALLVAVGPFAVASYLVVNGVTMARREGMRLVNLLSLLAGIAIFAVIAVDLAAGRAGSVKLTLLTSVATLVFGCGGAGWPGDAAARGMRAAIVCLQAGGVAALVDGSCRLARRFADGLAGAGFEVLNEVQACAANCPG